MGFYNVKDELKKTNIDCLGVAGVRVLGLKNGEVASDIIVQLAS